MKQFRLKRVHVLAAGLVVSAAVAVLFFTMFIKPLQKSITTTEKNIAAEKQVADQRNDAEKAKLAAEAEERRVGARFDRVMNTRMPKLTPFETKDELAGEFFFWDFPRQEARVIDEWFRNSGAEVTGYSLPAWPTSLPDLGMKVLPPLTWNLTVTVKDFPAFQRWLLKLPHAPRFMVMGDIQIPGPRNPGDPLTVTVPVTLYEWTPAAGATAVVATADTSGGTGMGGGPGGGGPGGGMRGGGMRGGGMRGGGGGAGGGMRGGGGGGGPGGGMRGGGGARRGGG